MQTHSGRARHDDEGVLKKQQRNRAAPHSSSTEPIPSSETGISASYSASSASSSSRTPGSMTAPLGARGCAPRATPLRQALADGVSVEADGLPDRDDISRCPNLEMSARRRRDDEGRASVLDEFPELPECLDGPDATAAGGSGAPGRSRTRRGRRCRRRVRQHVVEVAVITHRMGEHVDSRLLDREPIDAAVAAVDDDDRPVTR